MLSDHQAEILKKINTLQHQKCSVVDSMNLFYEITDLLAKYEDAEYAELVGTNGTKSTFVQTCRIMLVEAQETAHKNYQNYLSNQRSVDLTSIPADTPEEELNEPSIHEARQSEIMNSFLRMKTLAEQGLAKSELNIDELDLSSKTLTDIQSRYSKVDILLIKSKKLVSILDSADKWDRRMMQCSMGFLGIVVAYIAYRRILGLPVKILKFIIFRVFGVLWMLVPKSSSQKSAVGSQTSEITNMVMTPSATTAFDSVSTIESIVNTTQHTLESSGWVKNVDEIESVADVEPTKVEPEIEANETDSHALHSEDSSSDPNLDYHPDENELHSSEHQPELELDVEHLNTHQETEGSEPIHKDL